MRPAFEEWLRYKPRTGELVWIKRPANNVRVGAVVDNNSSHRYMRVVFRGKVYFAHRVAWYLKTGDWPVRQIDHKNGDRHDNRWSNLRLATSSQQHANTGKSPHNKSGYKGVSRYKDGKRWCAQIMKDRRAIHLGLYPTKIAAHAAYVQAAKKLFGKFARAA